MRSVLTMICVIGAAVALNPTDYDDNAKLHDDYTLYWKVDEDAETIRIGVSVNTAGFVGFGLSPDGGMVNADIMIGWVDDGSGDAVITDRMADAFAVPPSDSQQDWQLVAGEQLEGVTNLEFTRAWSTNDNKDYSFKPGSMRIIWAWGSSDNLEWHGSNRGQASVVFWGSQIQPPSGDSISKKALLMSELEVPSRETTYMCRGLSLPVDTDYHAIYFQPEIKNPNVVHHILIFECDSPAPETPFDCEGMRAGCTDILYAWAVGGPDFELPAEAGMRFKKNAMIEVHYNNPSNLAGIRDSSGINMYYTSELRRHDVGILLLGSPITNAIDIPPGKPAYQISRLCQLPGKDTGDGATVFAYFLHMHSYGQQMWVAQYRNGEYVGNLGETMKWDFNIQEIKALDPPGEVRAGDTLLTTGVWDTSSATTRIKGGDASGDEMGLAFLFYYPKVNVDFCFGNHAGEGDFDGVYPWDDNYQIPVSEGEVTTYGLFVVSSVFASFFAL